MKKLLKITFTLLFITIILLGFVMPLNPAGNWYQQFMPNLHGAIIKDIKFTDSLTGYAVTNVDSFNTAYILKTTNGGDNWFNSLTDNIGFTLVQFVNSNTGFVGRLGDPPNYNRIFKTTNAGSNWLPINTPVDIKPIGMHVLNKDTIWIADDITSVGGIYRTTNGGSSWLQQYGAGGGNPSKIYMYNARMGFMCNSSSLYRTTNSGVNWSPVSGGGFSEIYFIDSSTGWKANGDMKKTTDSGLNWITQAMPNGGNIFSNGMAGFHVLNKDTLWGTGGLVSNGGIHRRGILYRTSNGGNNWLYQIVDTSFGIGQFYDIQFVNTNTGWGFGFKANVTGVFRNIHTTNGGDTSFLVGLQQVSTEVPRGFKLFQNYPNPFNPLTNIKYSIMPNVKGQMSNVKLTVFDITGKEIEILVSRDQNAGTYLIDWNGSAYSSGVYFYRLTVATGKGVFEETKKLILVK